MYVLVTKCDLVAGFSEFFDDLGQEGRAQVWGTTFPIEASETGTRRAGRSTRSSMQLLRAHSSPAAGRAWKRSAIRGAA